LVTVKGLESGVDFRRRAALLSLLLSLPPTDVRADERLSELVARLASSLPRPWGVDGQRSGVLPEGHYWGQEYFGARGEEIVLIGADDVHIEWLDSKNAWHREAVGKEALKIYVMPITYRESFRRYFVLKRPKTAQLLVETQTQRIYAIPAFKVTSDEMLARTVRQANAVRWPDSPENTGNLSWPTWRTDLSQIVKASSVSATSSRP
jgi:hypothetical protein